MGRSVAGAALLFVDRPPFSKLNCRLCNIPDSIRSGGQASEKSSLFTPLCLTPRDAANITRRLFGRTGGRRKPRRSFGRQVPRQTPFRPIWSGRPPERAKPARVGYWSF